MSEHIGEFDDVPAVHFNKNFKPLPDGYDVVWFDGDEMYRWVKRGTDISGLPSWDKFWCRRCCFAYAEAQKK